MKQHYTSDRSVARHQAISRALRQAIHAGDVLPGDQLPARQELESEFNVTNMTIQRSIDQLKQEGAIYSRGRWGVFVADHPPCLHRFALVFNRNDRVQDLPWPLNYQALLDAAAMPTGWGSDSFDVYRDVAPPAAGAPPSDDYVRLLEDIEEMRVAGVIYASDVADYLLDPIVTLDGLPRVALSSGVRGKVSAVRTDRLRLLERAVDHLVAGGCKRVAILVSAQSKLEDVTHCRELLAKRDLLLDDMLVQASHRSHPQWARNSLLLLMALPRELRPDGIILTDDHFVSQVAKGLVESSMRVPEDVQVVAHANYPLRDGGVLPFHRIGFDAGEMLATCLAALRAQRETGRTEMWMIPPRTPDEVGAHDGQAPSRVVSNLMTSV